MKRLFLAIPLEEGFEKAFSRLRDSHGGISYLRWMPEKNLHITTLFLGAVKEGKVHSLKEELKSSLKHSSSFSLEFQKVDYAPPRKTARMVWAYFESNRNYADLIGKCMSAVQGALPDIQLGEKYKEGELEKMTPHITLARFRRDIVYPNELRRIGKTGLEGRNMEVDSVWLMESVRMRKGAEYDVVEKIYLP